MRKVLKIFLSTLIILFLAGAFLLKSDKIFDSLRGISYSPSETMLSIRDSLSLTRDGERIFNASHPVLDSRDDFNRDCESFDAEVSVLGCYSNKLIYVYNVDDARLAGIRESTTAHEFLHAAWARLSGIEKNELIPMLKHVYAENKDSLKDTIESYDESEQLDELYVRIGTQISSLPDALESHYAQYFRDRAAVVAFYTSYITPFNELNAEIESQKSRLSSLQSEIDSLTSEYTSRSADFSAKVNEFNSCANTSGCFASDYAFSSRRRTLVAEQNSLNDLYSSLDAKINEYNALVEVYNSNIVRSTDLSNLINSNSELKPLE